MDDRNARDRGPALPEVEHPPKPVRFIEHRGLDDLNHRGSEVGPADASKEGDPEAEQGKRVLTEPSADKGPDPYEAGRIGGAGGTPTNDQAPHDAGQEGRGGAQ